MRSFISCLVFVYTFFRFIATSNEVCRKFLFPIDVMLRRKELGNKLIGKLVVQTYTMILIMLFAVATHEGFQEKFSMQSRSTSQGLPYDFSSIMHFQHTAFSSNPNLSTVIPHNHTIPKIILGSSATATDLDFLHLNLLYCGGKDAILLHCCTFGGIYSRILYFMTLMLFRERSQIFFSTVCVIVTLWPDPPFVGVTCIETQILG